MSDHLSKTFVGPDPAAWPLRHVQQAAGLLRMIVSEKLALQRDAIGVELACQLIESLFPMLDGTIAELSGDAPADADDALRRWTP